MVRKTIIILHGWQSQLSRWRAFEIGLNKQFRVFLPLIPGFRKNKLEKAWFLNDYVNWLREYIKKNEIKKPILVGHSNGGRIAIAYAVRNKPAKLILIASSGIKPTDGFKKSFFYFLAKSGKIFFSLSFLERFKKKASWLLYTLAREKDYYKAGGFLKPTMVNLLNEDLQSRLPKIKTDTLIFWGKSDRITPLKDAYVFNKKINRSKLIVYPGVGHNLPFVKTKKITDKIKEFCK